MVRLINNLIFYPACFSLNLFGFLIKKIEARPVTFENSFLKSYMEISGRNDTTVKLKWRDFLILKKNWRGRLRRYLTIRFNKKHVEEQIFKREGVCKRCGMCCCERKCPFVVQNNETWDCILHPHKPLNCTIYPINQKDVTEYGCRGFVFLN